MDETNQPNTHGRKVTSLGEQKDNENGIKEAKSKPPSDLELMKEKFAKLLLGEDMSGGGKGVSSALALSNAITNLAASVFGEQSKLEPMAPERKARWKKEVGWLLSVTDYIVEFVPAQQRAKDGSIMEVMATQQRRDLMMNIPALRKLDAMLIGCLDNFTENEFWYVSKDALESAKGVQKNDKWWLPTIKVPPNGLSDHSRKHLQFQKDCVNQVLKASLAINAQILSEMEIPEDYIESLPKNGRSTLGETIYKSITDDFFDPDQFLCSMDFSSEHKVLDLKNKMEASIIIWKRKMHNKDGKSPWGSAISLEKRETFEERAETILILLKQRFPGLAQSSLDISKIEYNKDVGFSILESYARVLESLANTVMNRIEDVLYADSVAQEPPSSVSIRRNESPVISPMLSPMPSPMLSPMRSRESSYTDDQEAEKWSFSSTPNNSMRLSDFMEWNTTSTANLEDCPKYQKDKSITKTTNNIIISKRFSYLDKISNGKGSPTSRH